MVTAVALIARRRGRRSAAELHRRRRERAAKRRSYADIIAMNVVLPANDDSAPGKLKPSCTLNPSSSEEAQGE
jgi:hypothetical protein